MKVHNAEIQGDDSILSTDHAGLKEIEEEIDFLKSKQNNVTPCHFQKVIAMEILGFSHCITAGSGGENRIPGGEKTIYKDLSLKIKY